MSEIFESPPKYVITLNVFAFELKEALNKLVDIGDITYLRKGDE